MNLRGFTLLELMTALAVVGILSAVAYPSYVSYTRRAQATDAVNLLSQYRLAQEQTFQDNGNYGVGTTCSVDVPATTPYFSYSCVPKGNPATGFTVKATGVQSMAGFAYQLDDSGNRITLAFPERSGLPAGCWLLKSGDC
jgi:type IV pilus assembly protein PilE